MIQEWAKESPVTDAADEPEPIAMQIQGNAKWTALRGQSHPYRQ